MDKVIIIFVVAIPALKIMEMVNAAGREDLQTSFMRRAAEIDAKCKEQTNADTEAAKQFLAGEVESNVEFKCYVRCVMHEAAVLSHTGDFDLEYALTHVPKSIEEIGHKMIHDCKHIKDSDLCEMAFQIHRCYHDVEPEGYQQWMFLSKCGSFPLAEMRRQMSDGNLEFLKH